MADFRKWLFALAVVALLAGLTVPASAQSTVVCTVQSATDNLVRNEGYTEQVGDVVLACTGGTPTAPGAAVPPINIQVFLSLNVTSRITAVTGSASAGGTSTFLEALLIIDEPNSATNPAVPLLNCGAPGAPDNTLSGPGVCTITSAGNIGNGAPNTYNGTPGHPNVFQGRQPLNSFANTSVVFQGVPFDPPGTATRFLRFTNIRVNANQLGISAPTQQIPITMGISSSGTATLPLSFLSLAVATAQRGLSSLTQNKNLGFAQCIATNSGLLSSAGPFSSSFVGSPTIRFQEGFSNAWKPRNIALTLANGTYSIGASGDAYTYGLTSPTSNPVDLNQNVPGTNYYTEAGFESSSAYANPSPNPPLGFQNFGSSLVTTTSGGSPLVDATTGISSAGHATQGTRLAIALSNIPNGLTIFVPPVVFLYRQGHAYTLPTANDGFATGVMVLTTTAADGSGAYNPPTSTTALQGLSATNAAALVVYEVLFADPFSNEYADVPFVISYSPALSSNPPLGLPQPSTIASYQTGFAPFYSTSGAFVASSSLPIPRFFFSGTGDTLLEVQRCSCNLLFPFVTQAPGYDTGIAIANTTVDPFGTTAQAGTVTFNYYGSVYPNSPPPGAQTSSVVQAGTLLLYTLYNGGTGLDNRGAGFTGYLITQAQFQYCHGFAFIGALGGGPTGNALSEGYLALVLDYATFIRGSSQGESLGH